MYPVRVGSNPTGGSRKGLYKMENIVFRGQFAFSIKNDMVTIWMGTKHIPFAEWERIAHFHKMLIDEIVAGLTALKKVTE